MKSNYAAWDLHPQDFDSQPADKRLAFLVRFAVLAPSSHNSQPWKFVVERDAVIVSVDPTRELKESDPTGRQMYQSVGCAIENLVIAADYYGYRTSVEAVTYEGGQAWRVHCAGGPNASVDRIAGHAALSISRRVTNRSKYEMRLPEQSFLAWMRACAASANVELHVVEESPEKVAIAKIVSDALVEAMDSVGFRQELSGYVRANTTSAATGMPMFGFGMPTPPSLIAPWVVRTFNVNRGSRKNDERLLVRHTPVFGIIATHDDEPRAWVTAGRVAQRIAVEAVRRGLATAQMAGGIEIGPHPARLQKILNTSQRPQVFFRLGYALGSYQHSPRLPAEAVTTFA